MFGRLGCFLGGCCYGSVCEAAWWATPPSWYPAPVGGIPRYPTAFASALFALGLFFALRWIRARRAFEGEVFLAMLVLYAPGRYVIEALRADPRGGAGGLSTTQLLVLVSGAPALALWVAGRLRAPKASPKDSSTAESPVSPREPSNLPQEGPGEAPESSPPAATPPQGKT